MALYALDVLHIASLVPYTRRAIVGASVNNRSGMAILLSAAGGHAFLSEPEVRETEAAHQGLGFRIPQSAAGGTLSWASRGCERYSSIFGG